MLATSCSNSAMIERDIRRRVAVTWHSEDLKEKKASHPHRHRMRTERASPAGGWAAGTDRARRGSDHRSLIALAAAFAHAQVWFAGLLER